MNYLGHIVRGGALKIDPSKVEVIVNWPKPKSSTEVRIFLGVAQYWRKFIAAPLHALTGLKQVFKWGGEQQKAFNTLKEKISTAPVLVVLDLQHPFEIEIDASDLCHGSSVDATRKTHMLSFKDVYLCSS